MTKKKQGKRGAEGDKDTEGPAKKGEEEETKKHRKEWSEQKQERNKERARRPGGNGSMKRS